MEAELQQSHVGGVCLEIGVNLRQHAGARQTRQTWSCQAPLAMANFTLLPSKPSFTADVPRSLRVDHMITTSTLDVATVRYSFDEDLASLCSLIHHVSPPGPEQEPCVLR